MAAAIRAVVSEHPIRFTGRAMISVISPPRPVTNPLMAASLACNRTMCAIARSSVPCLDIA